ncbi:MAG TPA: cytochrome c biogenesis protein CcdA [Dehalococcoidia bacterium]|nr:cytochrome c biogenesis protein CcdA [Dehalococcoidia bacterium]
MTTVSERSSEPRSAGAGYVRSATIGAAFSVGWTPCVGPVLGALLGLAATNSGVAEAGVLLAVYSLGFSIPFLAMGAFFATTRGLLKHITPYLGAIEFVSGALIILIGILIFTGSLINLNSFFTFAEVDQVEGDASIGLSGVAIAFAAGLVSVFSPCVLPMVPVYLGYLTGSTVDADGNLIEARGPLLHATAFVLGFSIVFIVLGLSVGLVGYLLRDQQDILEKVAGVLLIVLGLQLSGIISIPWLQQERRLAF